MKRLFAPQIPERRYQCVRHAMEDFQARPILDELIDLANIQITPGGELVLRREGIPMTRSAFIQLLSTIGLTWGDVREEERPADVFRCIQKALHNRGGMRLVRMRQGIIQTFLSPKYTPITNLEVLEALRASMDLSKVAVTTSRGSLRITGVTDGVHFHPQVGDIISGGVEVAHNEFGKGALSVQQFLLRLVCTNGAVVSAGGAGSRYIHKGWDRHELIAHLRTSSERAILSMRSMNEQLRLLTQKRLGVQRLNYLAKELTMVMGQKAMMEFGQHVGSNSSVYDAYNYVTWISQGYRMDSRRRLEVIAGGLLG